MLGLLEPEEIETLLHTELVGHLGCHAGGRTYVVPITYAYADNAIYARSIPGLKVNMMRENPDVCFQVSRIDDMNNWKSVILWGRYEELRGPEAGHATATILGKILPRTVSPSATQSPKSLESQSRARTEDIPVVTFRIKIVEKTGRFEQPDSE